MVDQSKRILDDPRERDGGGGARLIGHHLAHPTQDVGGEMDLLPGRLQPLAHRLQRRPRRLS